MLRIWRRNCAIRTGGRLNEKRNENIEPKSEPKRRVGPFELERKLGVGGMGVVYLGDVPEERQLNGREGARRRR